MRTRETPPFSRDRLVHVWIFIDSLSDAGDAIWTIALAWTAVQMASPAVAGAVVAAGTIPRALVLLIGGVVADRYDGRRVMIFANLTRVAVLLGTAAWVSIGGLSLTVLLIVAILFGVTDAIYQPAGATIGRQLVRAEDMPAYAGVAQTGSRLGTMAGAAIGGFLVANAGIEGSASVNSLTFAIVVLFLALWLRPRYPLDRAESEPVLRAIRKGFTHLRQTPTTRTLVISLSGLNLAVTPALGLGIPLLALENDWGASTVGVFQAFVALGATIGSLSLIHWRPTYAARWAFSALITQGLAIFSLGFGSMWIAGAASLIIGITAGVASVLLISVFVTTVEGAFFGRMAAIQQLGDDVLMPLMMILFGSLASLTSVTGALAAYGVTMAAVMTWPLFNRRMRQGVLQN